MVFLDESHVTIPQLKECTMVTKLGNLVQFGFRLPSALDNRPLKYEEFRKFALQTLYVSATPGPFELEDARDRSVLDCSTNWIIGPIDRSKTVEVSS